MTRNEFIKKTLLSSTALCILPQLSFASTNKISPLELIGKGTPTLLGNGYKLRQEAHLAFLKLKAEALKEGINISIASSFRSYDHQERIWNRKYKKYKAQGFNDIKTIEKIIEYSTIPGTSRHHWGTDMDIYDTNVKQPKSILLPNNYHGNGPYCKLKEWMDTNASRFGFFLVYTNNGNRKGFKYEPWHYSYKPLSANYLKAYKTLDIKKLLQENKLLGSSNFTETFINTYTKENILDINPELL